MLLCPILKKKAQCNSSFAHCVDLHCGALSTHMHVMMTHYNMTNHATRHMSCHVMMYVVTVSMSILLGQPGILPGLSLN